MYKSKKQDNVFFMEIFNDILKINDNNIMIVYDDEIDKCIKKIMKNQEYIKNKEFYKISLNCALI